MREVPTPPSACGRRLPYKGRLLLYCPLKAPLPGELAAPQAQTEGFYSPAARRFTVHAAGYDPALRTGAKGLFLCYTFRRGAFLFPDLWRGGPGHAIIKPEKISFLQRFSSAGQTGTRKRLNTKNRGWSGCGNCGTASSVGKKYF